MIFPSTNTGRQSCVPLKFANVRPTSAIPHFSSRHGPTPARRIAVRSWRAHAPPYCFLFSCGSERETPWRRPAQYVKIQFQPILSSANRQSQVESLKNDPWHRFVLLGRPKSHLRRRIFILCPSPSGFVALTWRRSTMWTRLGRVEFDSRVSRHLLAVETVSAFNSSVPFYCL